MHLLSINQEVFIRRTDGRMQTAVITKLEGGDNNIVTVEWGEGQVICGKELPLSAIQEHNPQIYDKQEEIVPLVQGQMSNSMVQRSVVVTATPRVQTDRTRVNVVSEIERLAVERERRRLSNEEARYERSLYRNEDPENPNWEIARMLRLYRLRMEFQPIECMARSTPRQHQIVVCVRKRPLNRKELDQHQLDVITVPNGEHLVVHEPRKQLDLTKFLEHHKFRFDHTFDEHCTNAEVYKWTACPMINHIFEGGMATCFAYGQTGSGKTHTMGGQFVGRQQNSSDGIYALAAKDVFKNLQLPKYAAMNLHVSCSFFELYGTRVYDLLMPGKPELRVLEDGKQRVQVVNLTEKIVTNANEVLHLLELGNKVRTSGKTSANSNSSRSHAVFQLVLRSGEFRRMHGKISIIDLAGNERGADNCSINRQTRLEGSEINKSLLALKECIRALGRQSSHLPFRSSKLTQVLRDSFIGGKQVRTCMIAMISPGLHSVEHTLNTLRYADRVKELTTQLPQARAAPVVEQRNSLPDISSTSNQAAAQVNVVSSSTSLPELDPEAEALRYFNEAIENYDRQRQAARSFKQ